VIVPSVIAGLLMAAALGALAVDRVVMPHVVHLNKGIVPVPAIARLPYEQARQKLYDVGLVCRMKAEEYSDTMPVGAVVRQYLEPGTQVKRGRHVDVAVSKGPAVAAVPAVRGMAEHIARLELQKKGFAVGRTEKKYDDKMPADHVINASPPEGTKISRDMEVGLQVSRGPKPTHAVMVSVVGEGLADARAKIEEAGLQVGAIDYQDSPTLAPGTIVSQSVPPGASVPLESSVKLVVSVRRN